MNDLKKEILLDEYMDMLRHKEQNQNNNFAKIIGNDIVRMILLNRRFKYEHKLCGLYSDLENYVYNHEGFMIKAMIASMIKRPEFCELKSVPFPKFDISIEEFLQRATNKNYSEILFNY